MSKEAYAGLVHHCLWAWADHRALSGELVSVLLRRNFSDYFRLYGNAAKIKGHNIVPDRIDCGKNMGKE